MLGIRFWFR